MNTVHTSDEDLMRLFQEGDPAAFETLFRRYRTPIFAFLLRQCGDRETASDLSQDVFARLIRSARSFQHQSKFSTWIYTIARNAAVDNARRARHRAHASLEDSHDPNSLRLGDRLANDDPGPDRSAIAERLREELAVAIDTLPPEQREVFLLREYHGMPFHEITHVVGAKLGTVKSRMRYALEALRRELHTYEEYARTLP